MNLLKKLASETAIYGISSILSRLLNWVILTPYFTRIFSPQDYGIVSDLYVWTALLLVILTYRMETAFFRFGKKKEDLPITYSTSNISLLFSTLVFLCIGFLLLPDIATILKYPNQPQYVLWFLLIIALDVLSSIPFAKLRLDEKPIRFAILKTSGILFNILFVFLLMEYNPFFEPKRIVENVFIANFLASLIVLLLLIPSLFKISWKFDFQLWKQMLLYAAPLVLAGIAGIINQLIGIPMLKELSGPSLEENLKQAGIFSAASKIAILMALFTQAFNYAAEPFFFKNADHKESKNLYAQIAQFFALGGSIAFLGVMLFLDVIQLFLGKDFRQGLHIVPILLLAYLFLGLYYNFSAWFKLTDKTRYGGGIALGGTLITLSMNYFLIPIIGISAPAWAALACYFFMAAATYIAGQKHFPIPYSIPYIILYIGIALIAWLISISLPFSGILTNIVIFISTLFLYFLLKPSTPGS